MELSQGSIAKKSGKYKVDLFFEVVYLQQVVYVSSDRFLRLPYVFLLCPGSVQVRVVDSVDFWPCFQTKHFFRKSRLEERKAMGKHTYMPRQRSGCTHLEHEKQGSEVPALLSALG